MIGTPRHDIGWVAPAPLWKGSAKEASVLLRPTLLAFGHDGFMDELVGTLAAKPENIEARVAKRLVFRARQPGEPYGASPPPAGGVLKLYQPIHGWFYLVTGSLVCRRPGFPEHPVDLGAGESAGFVVRRYLDEENELALVVDEAGGRSWRKAEPLDTLVDGEQVLPAFPLSYRDGERRRRLLAGVIPTGSQDLFLSAPMTDGAPPPGPDEKPAPVDAYAEVQGKVGGAIRALKAAPAGNETQQREATWFALMDLADFLTFHLPSVMDRLQHGTALSGKARALADLLGDRKVDPTVDRQSLADLVTEVLDPNTPPTAHNLRNANADLASALENGIFEALDEASPGALTPVTTGDAPKIADTRYVTRLVYRRPRCTGLAPEVVSPRSEPFLLAPYFDPDAPSRPIRIALPIDASLKGLRQFRKNVRMVLSESLRQKTATKKINDKIDGPDLACGAVELSIPIITIVAMIILFVFISLLNIVFWWIPFVKICLPRIKVEP